MYVRIGENLRRDVMPSTAAQVASSSVFQRIQDTIQDAVRRGKATVAMTQALLRGLSEGIRDVNDLTNLVFFARHPKRGDER